jgi:hypothetical protein
MQLHLANWFALAPGLESPEQWRAWARGDAAIRGSEEPVLDWMPALQRRRLEPIGKMALHVTHQCRQLRPDAPIVYCTQYGEVARSIVLLGEVARGEPMSPMGFSLSVHNAVGGMYSIAQHDTRPYAALAAGVDGLAAGVIEAAALLADGAHAVIVTCYDAPLPPPFEPYAQAAEVPYAFAWLLTRDKGDVIDLRWEGGGNTDLPCGPRPLAVLRFVLRGDGSLRQATDRQTWIWSRDVAND